MLRGRGSNVHAQATQTIWCQETDRPFDQLKDSIFQPETISNFIRLICFNMPVIEFCFTQILSLITTTHVVIVWLRNSIVWMTLFCFNTTTISFSFPIYSCKITAYRLVLVRKKSTNPPHKQFQKGKILDVFRLIPNLNSNTIFT